MRTNDRIAALLAALALAACGGSGDGSTASARSALLVDARSGGASGFWFLPPVAAEPDDATPNRRGLSPGVEIVELAPGASGVIAAFDDVKDSGAHYQADWHASASPLAPAHTYRIVVSLSGVALGYADAKVTDDGAALEFLFSGETFPLTGERALPIKFRITEPAPDADGDLVPDASDDCASVPDGEQVDSDSDGVGDACECVGVVCPPSAQCHVGACDPRTGACVAAAEPDGSPCDDGDACTGGDRCVAGVCETGSPLSCEPPDACHLAGACDPASGACSTPPPAPDGTPCPLSTGTGTCQAGLCVAVPSRCGTCGGWGGGGGTCTGSTCGAGETCGGCASGCATCSGDCCGCGSSGSGGMFAG